MGVLIMVFCGSANGKPVVLTGVEISKTHKYRVFLMTSSVESGLTFNMSDFKKSANGMAPFGARIHIKNKGGKELNYSRFKGYSSSDKVSALQINEMVPLSVGERIYSPWFDVVELLNGIDIDERTVEQWKNYKITFSVLLSTGELPAESDWLDFSPDLFNSIKD